MSRPKYGVPERLVRRWGIMDPGLAKTVVISAVAVSSVMVINGCAICNSSQWNCFASIFFATVLMSFATASVMVTRSLSPSNREEA
ncbi:hypothetical protein V1508DRAFT_427752, partial [Lipomyces doorenjongii]|uniref:uncharacterized protein n=1 Tax=Lipomyces doorenjongii TaxID=383834 RepID=UPI0034CDA12B